MELLKVKEVAAELNVTVGAVYALVNSGVLRARRLGAHGGAMRIDRADLERYLDSTVVAPGHAGPAPTKRRPRRSSSGLSNLAEFGYQPGQPAQPNA